MYSSPFDLQKNLRDTIAITRDGFEVIDQNFDLFADAIAENAVNINKISEVLNHLIGLQFVIFITAFLALYISICSYFRNR